AEGYLNALTPQLQGTGFITRDIRHDEAWDFHTKVFSDAGLSADAWTLNSVFTLMGNYDLRERYWQEVLNTAGDPIAEAFLAIQTDTFMANMAAFGNPQVREIATSWRSRVDTPSTLMAASAGAGNMVSDPEVSPQVFYKFQTVSA
ncbi:MAG: hypothetical protein ACREUI_07610, partial [Burkholderiales bacterium]